MQLTDRDRQLLAFLVQHKAAPMDVIARRFFAYNPFDGTVNSNPERAARTRLKSLAKAGMVSYRKRRLSTQGEMYIVQPLSAGAHAIAAQLPTTVPSRNLDHHAATHKAVLKVREEFESRGYVILKELQDMQVRSDALGGRITKKGDAYSAFADGVLHVRDPSGQERTIAIEYVTSKYTNQMIVDKFNQFKNYDSVYWFSDKVSTTTRVNHLTDGGCVLL